MKRGESVLLMIFELLAVVVIILITISIAKAFSSDEGINKIKISQDLGMMVNLLAGIPDNSLVKYPYDVSKYTILLDSEKVIVKTAEDQNFVRSTYRFILPEGYIADGFISQKANICFKKENTKENKRIALLEC